MPKAKKLASGSWTCRVYDHTEIIDGKERIIQKRFTVSDPSPEGRRKCERMAAEWAASHRKKAYTLTVNDVISRCLEAKKDILSPSTLRAYLGLQKNAYSSIGSIRIDQLTNERLQRWADGYARTHSPKTCRNAYGLLISAVTMFSPSSVFRVNLPASRPVQYVTPSDEDIKRLLEEVKGTNLEKAILLAAFGTLRAGEVCALTVDDIDGNTVHVNKSMVMLPGGGMRIKTTKNATSTRDVEYPPEVIRILKRSKGRIVPHRPSDLSSMLSRAQKRAGVPHFRFHDLRAYSASIMHALGVPDVYIMRRGGWKTDATLKKVYRRSIEEEERRNIDKINAHYSQILKS